MSQFNRGYVKEKLIHFDLLKDNCDLLKDTFDILMVTFDLLQVTCNLFKVTCNLLQVTCNLWRSLVAYARSLVTYSRSLCDLLKAGSMFDYSKSRETYLMCGAGGRNSKCRKSLRNIISIFIRIKGSIVAIWPHARSQNRPLPCVHMAGFCTCSLRCWAL